MPVMLLYSDSCSVAATRALEVLRGADSAPGVNKRQHVLRTFCRHGWRVLQDFVVAASEMCVEVTSPCPLVVHMVSLQLWGLKWGGTQCTVFMCMHAECLCEWNGSVLRHNGPAPAA